MAVYNGEQFIRSAMDSVLNQTFGDFELLIVDDGSTDGTADIIHTNRDPRIRCVRNAMNLGLARSLQVGISLTQAEYVARLDADDICMPHRLAYQVSYLDAHPQIAVLGSAYEVIDETGSLLQTCFPPTSPLAIAWRLLFGNPLAHSSVMFRRDVIVHLGGYDENIRYAQDYNLWSRVSAAGYDIAQLDVPLIRLREHPSQISLAKQTLSHESALHTAQDNIQRMVGYPVNPCVMAYLLLFNEKPPEPDLLAVIYQTFEACLLCFAEQRTKKPGERRLLLQASLLRLLQLARLSESRRLQASAIALRFGARYSPLTLLTKNFLIFMVKVITPVKIRRFFFRPGIQVQV